MLVKPKAFEQETNVWLFPTQDVKEEKVRMRNNHHIESPSVLASQLEIIWGRIKSVKVTGEPFSVSSTLKIFIEDENGGTSEIYFTTVETETTSMIGKQGVQQVTGYTNAKLHPSTELKHDDKYTWTDPQPIYDYEFI